MHNKIAKNYFRGRQKDFKFTPGSCCELVQRVLGRIRGHLNIWQAKKCKDRQESPSVFPGDLMNNVKEKKKHTLTEGLLKSFQFVKLDVQYSVKSE